MIVNKLCVSTVHWIIYHYFFFFFFQAEDGIRDLTVTGVQTCALPILARQQEEELAAEGRATLVFVELGEERVVDVFEDLRPTEPLCQQIHQRSFSGEIGRAHV